MKQENQSRDLEVLLDKAVAVAEGKKRSFADTVVDHLLSLDIDLFIDEETGNPLASFPDKSFVAYQIDSRHFTDQISSACWKKFGKGITDNNLKQVLASLRGKAIYDGVSRKVWNRTALYEDSVYYDLADNQHVVRIAPGKGFSVETTSPVKFYRYPHHKRQVIPLPGKCIELLRGHINVRDDESWLLLWTYLPVALMPNIPRCLIEITGQKGAAKSTAARMLSSIIDPSAADLMAFSKKSEDVLLQASRHYFLAYDNLSKLSPEDQNILCGIVTGRSEIRRKLYTDSDEVILNHKAVVCLTSIEPVVKAQDLIDRSISIELEPIERSHRKSEEDIQDAFERDKPYILGAVFGLLSESLVICRQLPLTGWPRMADYVKLAASVAQAGGHSVQDYLAVYSSNEGRKFTRSIDDQWLIKPLEYLLTGKEQWTGSCSDLLRILREIAAAKIVPGLSFESLPKTANALSRELGMFASVLLVSGIKVERDRSSVQRLVRIVKVNLADAVTMTSDVQESNPARKDLSGDVG